MKLNKKIFLFISLIYISISYDTQYFSCENRIYCDSNILSFNDLNNLCSTLLTNNRYIIFVSNKLIYPDDNSYTILSENFFKNYCVNTVYGCKNSFGIFIYIQSGKILIVAGQNVKSYVNQQNRLNIIQTMIPYLKNNNYYTGLEVGIKNLEKILRLNSNESSGISFFWIIIIILGIGLCIYCIFKSSENIINQEIEINNNNEINNDLNAQLYENNNNNYMSNNINNNSLEIHNHLIKLQNLINIIRQNSPPIIKINQCLICMQQIILNNNTNINYNNKYGNENSNYIEMNNINDINNNNNNDIINCRFACQHIYHNSCLIQHNLNYCIMCYNNNNENCNKIISNNSDFQILNEENIVSFAKNLNLIYNKNDLNIYIQNYSNEFDTFNSTLFLGLTSAWGIVATGALLMNDYNYNNNEYNNNYNNNNNNYDNNNVDTIGGMYNSNNINDNINNYPSNYNNDLDIKSPNFGKFSNNNNNINGTDFGGEDIDNEDF